MARWQPKNLKSELPCNPAMLNVVTYPKELKVYPKDTLHTHVHGQIIHNSQEENSIHVFINIMDA